MWVTLQDLWTLLGTLRVDLLGELALATLLGGLIGLEREASGKPAGLRTNILICVGATLITDMSMNLGITTPDGSRADSARLAAQIVSGIGFLGAGTIIQARGTVTGLTSAATLWVVAAIGIAIGARHPIEAAGTGLLVLMVLVPLGWFERRLSASRSGRLMLLELARSPDGTATLNRTLSEVGLTVRSEHLEIDGDRLRIRMDLHGSPAAWAACRAALLVRDDVRTLQIL